MPNADNVLWIYAFALAALVLGAVAFDMRHRLAARWEAARQAVRARRIAKVTPKGEQPASDETDATRDHSPPTLSMLWSKLRLPNQRADTASAGVAGANGSSDGGKSGEAGAPNGTPPLQGRARFATDVEFLPAALEILETPPSPVATTLMLAICAAFVTALAWSCIGTLDIHAVAQGKIQPSGRSKVVQPLEAGRVAAILVKNGSVVAVGDVLVELDPTDTTADLRALSREHESVVGESIRRKAAIAAVRDGRTIQVPNLRFDPIVGEMVRRRERAVLAAELTQLRSTLDSANAQLAERRATKARLASSIEVRQKLLRLSKERVGMREEIRTRGAGSRALIIEAELQYQNIATTDASERGQLIETDAAIESLEKKKLETIAQFIADQTQRSIDADRRRDRLEQEIVKARSRRERTQLKSPIAGTVQQLDISTLGQVVGSGQSIASVVPTDAPLEIEALIANKDIGFINAGQEAAVKVEAFPFTRYGSIDAEVVTVSTDAIDERNATTMMDAATAARAQNNSQKPSPGQSLVFPATLKLKQSYVMANGTKIPLTPGMAVTVEIKTGSRRAISFVLSPLSEVISTSGRER